MSYFDNLHFSARKSVFEKAKLLRKSMTPAEKQLWSLILNNKLLAFKFRRQHPISNYIADFYCHELKLVIELDGGIHQDPEQAEYDLGRSYAMQELGIRILRIHNDELWKNEDLVLDRIACEIKSLTTPSLPLIGGRIPKPEKTPKPNTTVPLEEDLGGSLTTPPRPSP